MTLKRIRPKDVPPPDQHVEEGEPIVVSSLPATKVTAVKHRNAIPLGVPAALFATDTQVIGPVPSPLDLLAYVPASTKASYELSEEGFIVHQEDSHLRRTVRYSNGQTVEVHIQGSQEIGRPTLEDVDFLLALFRLADERGVSADGRFAKPTYRDIVRAAGRRHFGSKEIAACKRALQRWGKLMITTRGEFEYTAHADAVRAGDQVPLAPDGSPRLFAKEQTYWVLEYDIEREERGTGDARIGIDTIGHLRINPVWLSQMDAGWLTWIDVDLHNALTSDWAKRIYQVFAIRASLGWRPTVPYTASLSDFVGELGYDLNAFGQQYKVVQRIRAAFLQLEEAGIIESGTIRKGAGWAYDVDVRPGDTLLVAGLLRGVSSHDPMAARLLLAHLRAQGISTADGRAMIREKPFQVRNVLCRVYYLLKVKRVQANPKERITNVGAWIRKAVANDWVFDDIEYTTWHDKLVAALAEGNVDDPAIVELASFRKSPRALGSGSGHPTASQQPQEHQETETPGQVQSPTVTFPDNIWGTVLREMYATVSEQPYRTWLEPTVLVGIEGDIVEIDVRDQFQADWLARYYLDGLANCTARVLNRTITLRCRGREASHEAIGNVVPTTVANSEG